MNKWPIVSLESVCSLITDGTHYSPPDIGSGLPFLTVKDMSENGLDFKECSYISKYDYELAEKGNCSPRKGDILFSKDGTVGKVHVVEESRKFAVLSSIAILRPLESRVYSGYLGQMLRVSKVQSQAAELKTGSALRRIILSDLKKVMFPLPPLDEQRRIAAILNKADALRQKRRQAIEKLDELAQSVYLDMFGDPETNPKNWPKSELGSLIRVRGGYAFKSDDFAQQGKPVIRISNLADETVNLSNTVKIPENRIGRGERFRIYSGDILIAMSGATTGKIGIVPFGIKEEIYQNQRVGRYEIINPKAINTIFLLNIIKSRYYKKRIWEMAWGAAQPNISSSQLESVIFPIPPMELQIKFAQLCESINNIRFAQVNACNADYLLSTSLQERAFSGEL